MENSISPGPNGWVFLVPLTEYFKLITDDYKELRRIIFEANVRDYQGGNSVNEDIQETLTEPEEEEDFWWLNNGITIIASKVSLAGKTVAMEDINIVNGLQTSTEIYKHFRDLDNLADARRVLVKVIVPSSQSSRDRIIKATNNQTTLAIASLRATDLVQRNIEDYFRTRGLFYDRRKNYYKNQGRPKSVIVSIPYLAQAIMAIILHEPDNSRARPSTLLKKDEDYTRVFDPKWPLPVFYACAEYMRKVDVFVRNEAPDEVRNEANNVRFHLAMFAAVVKANSKAVNVSQTNSQSFSEIDSEFLDSSLKHVWNIFCELRDSPEFRGDADKVAKSPDFLAKLVNELDQILAGTKSL